jgi:hypothetical protein
VLPVLGPEFDAEASDRQRDARRARGDGLY